MRSRHLAARSAGEAPFGLGRLAYRCVTLEGRACQPERLVVWFPPVALPQVEFAALRPRLDFPVPPLQPSLPAEFSVPLLLVSNRSQRLSAPEFLQQPVPLRTISDAKVQIGFPAPIRRAHPRRRPCECRHS